MRFLLLIACLSFWTCGAKAMDAPLGQLQIGSNEVLRGHFVEDRQMNISSNSLITSGTFVIAPAHGLIWSIEKPFPTATIITPTGFVQDIGGLAVKLSTKKNLRHLYDTVSAALAGDWSGLDKDFTVTPGGSKARWQVLLMPRPESQAKIPYTSITVSGGQYVEAIVMMKADGTHDMFTFSDHVLSHTNLEPREVAEFNEAQQ